MLLYVRTPHAKLASLIPRLRSRYMYMYIHVSILLLHVCKCRKIACAQKKSWGMESGNKVNTNSRAEDCRSTTTGSCLTLSLYSLVPRPPTQLLLLEVKSCGVELGNEARKKIVPVLPGGAEPPAMSLVPPPEATPPPIPWE